MSLSEKELHTSYTDLPCVICGRNDENELVANQYPFCWDCHNTTHLFSHWLTARHSRKMIGMFLGVVGVVGIVAVAACYQYVEGGSIQNWFPMLSSLSAFGMIILLCHDMYRDRKEALDGIMVARLQGPSDTAIMLRQQMRDLKAWTAMNSKGYSGPTGPTPISYKKGKHNKNPIAKNRMNYKYHPTNYCVKTYARKTP